jgi:hypothetical protein
MVINYGFCKIVDKAPKGSIIIFDESNKGGEIMPKAKSSYKEFYEVSKQAGTVRRALKDDAGFRKWYNKIKGR